MKRVWAPSSRNSLWAIAEYIWYPALLFLSTRYFLEHLGSHRYGIWMFLNAIVASSGILNVGIIGAVIKVVSAELGAGAGPRRIGELANSALGIALISGVLTVAVALGAVALGWRGVSSSTNELVVTAAAAAVLLMLEQIDAAFSSVLKGGEHFGVTARVEMLFKTVQIVAALAVTIIWSDLGYLFLALIAVSSCRVLTKMWRMRQVYGLVHTRPSLASVSTLIPYAKWGWVHGLGGFMLGVADRLIVASVLGAEALAFYSLLLMFPQQVHSMTAAAVGVAFPRISGLLSSGDIEAVKALRSRIYILTAVPAAIVTLILVVFAPEIFTLWLGKLLPPDAMRAMAPLCVAFFVLCLNVAPYYTLLGMGQVKYVAVINLVAGIASITVLVLLLDSEGLYGAALSKGVYAAVLLVQFYRVNQYLNRLMRATTA